MLGKKLGDFRHRKSQKKSRKVTDSHTRSSHESQRITEVSHEKVTDSHTRSSHEKLTRLTESHGSESQKVTESHRKNPKIQKSI